MKTFLQDAKQGILFSLLITLSSASVAQDQSQNIIDTTIFSDAAHHWYDISEKGNLINPRPGHPKYRATDIQNIADNILLYQKANGGWPKNYDVQAILTSEQKDTLLQAKNTTNTTFDNRTTYSQIAYLANAATILHTGKYKIAILKGLDFIIASQYNNGGWPQYYPLGKDYSRHITFNDDAYTGIMYLLKDITEGKPEYAFLDNAYKTKLQTAFNKGLDCVLKTQINDAGNPTAWCQQYDEVSLEPAWARKFEPPSICNGESVDVVLLLMSIKQPSKAVIDAVQNAVNWFNQSKITGIRVKTIAAPEMVTPYRISTTDKIVVADDNAPVIWTRYYELKTHQPLFCNRDSKVVYSLAEVERERRDGYAWYTYAPQKVLDKYPAWAKKYL
jgi:PelA/Pel-15E family pectate lyase